MNHMSDWVDSDSPESAREIRSRNARGRFVTDSATLEVVDTLGVDFAIASTGTAGPGGGTAEIPVGTIWLACGNAEKTVTCKLTEDYGRDINLAIATTKALQMFIGFLKEEMPKEKEEGKAPVIPVTE